MLHCHASPVSPALDCEQKAAYCFPLAILMFLHMLPFHRCCLLLWLERRFLVVSKRRSTLCRPHTDIPSTSIRQVSDYVLPVIVFGHSRQVHVTLTTYAIDMIETV